MARENREKVIRTFINDLYNDPTFLSFEFRIYPSSILFCTKETAPSWPTLDYSSLLNLFDDGASRVLSTPHILLKNLGEVQRDKLFMRFAKGLPDLFESQQWRIQSIEGLDSVFNNTLNIKDGYTGSGDEKISITCIEDINLTLFNLFEIYRICVYDETYKRQIIPNNLLQFDCRIEIKDKRNLRYDTKAKNSNNENFKDSNSTESEKSSSKSKLSSAISAARDGTNTVTNFMDSLKSAKQNIEKEDKYNFKDSAFQKPSIYIDFIKCKFDLSQITKTFENINPAESDNNWNKFTFSFTYGKTLITSSIIEDIKYYDEGEILNLENIENDWSNVKGNTEGRGTTLESLVDGGWNGALNSAKQYGQEYLDNVIDKEKNNFSNFANKVLGKEVGYEVGQNIYGQSNFISAFASKVGDRLTQTADEAISKLKGATIGKVKEFVNTQKAKVQGAMNNLESSLLNGGQKGKSPVNVLQSNSRGEAISNNPEFSKLSGNETVYDESTKTTPTPFEGFNIYENLPSGPQINS